MLDTVRWSCGDTVLPGRLRLIDQTRLPQELVYIETDDLAEIYSAIQRLVVRGAPAIGCAAALGLAAVCQHSAAVEAESFLQEMHATAVRLDQSRPTAVNLRWALKRCTAAAILAAAAGLDVTALKTVLVTEGLRILHEDMQLCRAIGDHGVELFGQKVGTRVLTHCNAGALAASDYGTALAPVYAAQERGLAPQVFADETRPLLQGARLTAWELQRAGVDVTLICDNMAAQVMREGRVDMVIVGADRIAANGDAANKIGTYGVAVLAQYHRIPFYVAAPYSTIDIQLSNGTRIPIEQRDAQEIVHGFGRRTAPDGCRVYNPAFDVTPAELITGLITERGILRPPYDKAIAEMISDKTCRTV